MTEFQFREMIGTLKEISSKMDKILDRIRPDQLCNEAKQTPLNLDTSLIEAESQKKKYSRKTVK